MGVPIGGGDLKSFNPVAFAISGVQEGIIPNSGANNVSDLLNSGKLTENFAAGGKLNDIADTSKLNEFGVGAGIDIIG